MNIKFEGKFKSITDFEWNNIPDFAVITGLNGAGKTQLLEMLSRISWPKGTVRDELGENSKVIFTGLKKPVEQNHIAFAILGQPLSFEVFNSLEKISKGMLEFRSHYDSFKIQGYYAPNPDDQLQKIANFISLKSGINKFGLSEDEIETFYPLSFDMRSDGLLRSSIGDYFFKYHHRKLLNQLKQFWNTQKPDQKRKYTFTDEQFEEIWGPPPWERLNTLLENLSLPYMFTNPEGLDFTQPFILKLINKSNNEPIDPKHLSTGEQISMNLAFAVFNAGSAPGFPFLLLMDEPDSGLHPSMCRKMLDIYENVLVGKYGMKIIITTHSPTTVALAPEGSVFLMTRNGQPRIKPVKCDEATSMLSEGFVIVTKNVKNVLVEDKDDEDFYKIVFESLIREYQLENEPACIFKPSKKANSTGGRNEVERLVEGCSNLGIEMYGIVDRDDNNKMKTNVFCGARYSIENYLLDPLVVYSALMETDAHPKIKSMPLSIGDDSHFRNYDNDELQNIADAVYNDLELILKGSDFEDFDKEMTECKYTNGKAILFPKWLMDRRGHDILSRVFIQRYNGKKINQKNLMKSFRRVRLIPEDLCHILKSIQASPCGT